MKRFPTICGFIVLSYGLSSCKKCTECTFVEDHTNAKSFQTECGKKIELERFEENWESIYEPRGQAYCNRIK